MSSRSKKKAKRLNQNMDITTKGISGELISNGPQNKSIVLQSPGKDIDIPRCGLCGKTKNLTKTECCDNWICDDEEDYVLFSFDRNSCRRNHRRFTLCGQHFESGHEGKWPDCTECKKTDNAEIYADSGTNEYNFEKLKNPPSYEPTRCSKCNRIIVLANGGYSGGADGYICFNCLDPELKSAAIGFGRKRK